MLQQKALAARSAENDFLSPAEDTQLFVQANGDDDTGQVASLARKDAAERPSKLCPSGLQTNKELQHSYHQHALEAMQNESEPRPYEQEVRAKFNLHPKPVRSTADLDSGDEDGLTGESIVPKGKRLGSSV